MLHKIQNDEIEVGIQQKGAELASIINRATGQEYMWEADPKYWGRHSSILFPFIGRLNQDQLRIAGHSYPMKQHGFARNTDFRMSKQASDQIIFELTSNEESLEVFPYRFRLEAQYHLEGKTLFITYRVFNQDKQYIYFSLGAHPAFKCPLNEGEVRSDYQLVFEQAETADQHLIENGLRTGATELVLDNDNKLPISDDLFDEDALIFKDLASNFATLEHKNGEKVLKFGFEGFPYLGIWSKNSESPFVCLEPWFGVADHMDWKGDFKDKEGIVALAESEVFECVHSVEVM
ncbi:MAG: aldose 1-epimerase family protein [Bacteroidota bacterium]